MKRYLTHPMSSWLFLIYLHINTKYLSFYSAGRCRVIVHSICTRLFIIFSTSSFFLILDLSIIKLLFLLFFLFSFDFSWKRLFCCNIKWKSRKNSSWFFTINHLTTHITKLFPYLQRLSSENYVGKKLVIVYPKL